MFIFEQSHLSCGIFVVYVNDIVITGNDQEGIKDLKQHLFNHFQTKERWILRTNCKLNSNN